MLLVSVNALIGPGRVKSAILGGDVGTGSGGIGFEVLGDERGNGSTFARDVVVSVVSAGSPNVSNVIVDL